MLGVLNGQVILPAFSKKNFERTNKSIRSLKWQCSNFQVFEMSKNFSYHRALKSPPTHKICVRGQILQKGYQWWSIDGNYWMPAILKLKALQVKSFQVQKYFWVTSVFKLLLLNYHSNRGQLINLQPLQVS